jgi:hypothetical protein
MWIIVVYPYSVGQVVWLWMFLHILAACVFLLLATMATGDTRREVCQNRLEHCNIIGKLAQLSVRKTTENKRRPTVCLHYGYIRIKLEREMERERGRVWREREIEREM